MKLNNTKQTNNNKDLPQYREMKYKKPNGEEIDVPERLAIHQHEQLVKKMGYKYLGDQNGNSAPPRGTPGRDIEEYGLGQRFNIVKR